MVLKSVHECLLGGREKVDLYSHYLETGPGKLAACRGGHIKKRRWGQDEERKTALTKSA